MIPMCPWLFVFMEVGGEGERKRERGPGTPFARHGWNRKNWVTGKLANLQAFFASTDSIPTFSVSLLRSYKKSERGKIQNWMHFVLDGLKSFFPLESGFC